MAHKNLKRHKENGKYGYKDESGNWIIQPIFLIADEFDRGTARVLLDGKWGYIKEDGSWLVEPSFTDASPFSEELARVRKGFFFGFINRKGEWFVEPTLLKATNFENDSLAMAEDLNSKCAFISNKGKMITDFSLDNDGTVYDSSVFMKDNRIRAYKGGKYGFLDSEGNWVIPPKYIKAFDFEEERTFGRQTTEQNENYELIDLNGNTIMKSVGLRSFNIGFKYGVAVVSVNDDLGKSTYVRKKYGVIDREGNWVVSPIFGDIDNFKEGFAITTKGGKKGVIDSKGNVIIDNIYDGIKFDDDYFIVEINKKVGCADKRGKIILAPKYNFCSVRKEGFLTEKNKKGYGFADLKGKEIIKPSLDKAPEFKDDGYAMVESQGEHGWIDRKGTLLGGRFFDDCRDFSDGMAPVKVDGLWGFIDEKGNPAVEPQFDDVRNFKNGVCAVGISGHWGLISKSGEWFVEPKFDEIKEFESGLAAAKIFSPKNRASKWGFIDEKAQYVIQPEFDDLKNFKGAYAKAQSNGKWGLVGRDGKWVVSPEFDAIADFSDGVAVVKGNGLKGLINEKGNILVEPKYDDIYKFSDAGVAEVKLNNKYGFINREGEEIVPLQIRDEAYFDTETRCVWAEIKRKWGLLDSNAGRWLIEPKYDEVYDSDGNSLLMRVAQGDKWGVIDYDDNMIMPPVSDTKYFEGDLRHGLLRVKSEGNKGYYDVLNNRWCLPPLYSEAQYVDRNLFIVKNADKFALADSEGKIYDNKWYDHIFQGHEVLWVKEDGKYGVMDKTRAWILAPTFGWVDYEVILFNRYGIIRVEIDGKKALADSRGRIMGGRTYDGMYPYNKGYFTVVDNHNYGLIDIKGNLVINTEHEETEPFFNGLALVKSKNRKYGYVDINGEWVVKPCFEWAESFKPKHGVGIVRYARAMIDGKYGVIDRKGNWIIEPKFEYIREVGNIMTVRENGKYGYLDLSGEWIVPPVYQEAEDFCNGYGKVLTDDFKYLFVDAEGKTYKRKPN